MSSFRIISFDGGGIKGCLSSALIRRIYERYPYIMDNVHLVSGTSTGSLIALALAYGLTPKEIDEIYCPRVIKYIFSPSRINIFSPKYSNRNLLTIINKIIPEGTTLGDLNKYVVVPSFNLTGFHSSNWGGVLFNNLPPYEKSTLKVSDVALSSSAAPTYFPSHNGFIDGAVVSNSPSATSLISALSKFNKNKKIEDFKVLSIGTGLTPRYIRKKTNKWGILQWAINPLGKIKLPLVSVLLNDSVPLEHMYCKELLKKNYFRLNPIVPQEIEMDDHKKVNYLKGIGKTYDLTDCFNFIDEYFLK